jgi:hypothetical protein
MVNSSGTNNGKAFGQSCDDPALGLGGDIGNQL